MHLICKRNTRVEHLQIRYKLNGCVTTAISWCVSRSKASLACVWDEERFYTAGPVLRNDVGFLADRKP